MMYLKYIFQITCISVTSQHLLFLCRLYSMFLYCSYETELFNLLCVVPFCVISVFQIWPIVYEP